MAIKRNKRFKAEIATSSLSDIMFFLLLFFLILSTLANPNVIKMMLPKAASNEKTNKQHLTISVTEDKRFFINKTEVPYEELEQMLLAELGGNTDQSVVIRIPFNSQIQELVDVLQIGVKHNIKFVIATQKQ
ncbi:MULTISPECIES: biopolymer transporter ExbD [unclassified Myroides]|uniref:ExbD/TolR family protein n=1 Tax=unclassified Myroides TaxID=2642485 RepID=UPI0015FD6A7B|nr:MULTISPECIES: biopolymer transporter ExbD [unclassified Myroides]MBB1148990.1 biopolymer transporter ExbD [Myroides sp. NP-2]MDM1409060.1 biopolymer transporter ExbD [Myroides sp. DF42-4-2]